MPSYPITGEVLANASQALEVVNPHLLSEVATKFAVGKGEAEISGAVFAAVTLPRTAEDQQVWYGISHPTQDYFFDHHPYIAQAIEGGAKTVLCERLPEQQRSDVLYIQVRNVISSLAKIAQAVVSQSHTKVIAVTGSSGKTTTAHAIYSVLKEHLLNVGKVYTYRPTPISLPLSILNLYCSSIGEGATLVLEMPTDHHGCITTLAQSARPDVGVVLNVMDAHLKIFGSMDEIARAKSEMIAVTSESGSVILNVDDARVRGMSTLAGPRTVIGFGSSPYAQVRGQVLDLAPTFTRFQISWQSLAKEMSLPLIGPASLQIALTSATVGLSLGLSLEQVGSALGKFEPMPGRMSWVRCDGNRVIIFDNSTKTNPINLRHMLSGIVAANWSGKKILVLGHFGSEEHPDLTRETWETIGAFFDEVILIGAEAHQYAAKLTGSISVHLATNLEEGAETAIQLADSTSGQVYLTVTGYITIAGRECAALNRIVEAVEQNYGH